MSRDAAIKDVPLATVPLVGPEMSAKELLEILIRGNATKAIVVDSNKLLLGIVTLVDLITARDVASIA
jgi:CBS domain containing-hemolysin-like protein